MKLKPRPLTFTAEDTVFEPRKQLAENLTNLVKNVEDGLVLALHADWGDGKTTFCKYWMQEHLEKNSISYIYLDAFQSDYNDDALMVITSEIAKFLKNKGLSKKKKALMVSAKKILSATVGVGIQAAIAATTAGVGNKALDGASDALKDLTKSYIDQRLEQRAKIDNDLKEFKRALQASLAPDRKLVFLIDELDRCKPRFAVEVLETIKHFFDVDGIIFLLAMNRNQLISSISGEYGIEREIAESYLKKFVFAEIRLPKKNDSRYGGDIGEFCDKLYDKSNLENLVAFALKNPSQHQRDIDSWVYEQKDMLLILAVFARIWDLSCRDVQDSYRAILLFYAVTPPTTQWFPFIMVSFLAVVRTKNIKIFEALRAGTLSYKELEENFPLPQGTEEKVNWARAVIRYCMADEAQMRDTDFISLDEQKMAMSALNGYKKDSIIPLVCKKLDFEMNP